MFLADFLSLFKRYWVHTVDKGGALADYVAAKGVDLKDYALGQNQPDSDGRYKSNAQEKWEKFIALFEYTKHLRFKLAKTSIDLVDSLVKKKIDAIKAAVKTKVEAAQDITRAKLDTAATAANHVQSSVNNIISRRK